MEKISLPETNNNGMIKLITAISIAVPVVVAVLLFMPSKIDVSSQWVYFLPHLNAVIKAKLAAVLMTAFKCGRK